MKVLRILFFIGMVFVLFLGGCAQKNEKVGNAPPDAFLDGSKYPYYGSEDNWDRRFFTEHITDFQKRRGQRQMLDISDGKFKEAADYARELIALDPSDLESWYNLAIAEAALGDIEEAIKSVQIAVDEGLPFERFLVGPRDMLKPLVESQAFKEYAKDFNVRLIHGPMVGSVTDGSANFWVRTAEESKVRIILSQNKSLSRAKKSSVVMSKAGADYTAIASVSGLMPDTEYYYDVLIGGKRIFKTDLPSFRTYPKSGDSSKFDLAFGGCAGYVQQHEHMWDLIDSKDPLALLLMGDNVYINMPEHLHPVHYYTYYRRQSRPEYRRLVSKTSVYAIWDDHDCATDDVWMGPYKDKPSWKPDMFTLFTQNWVNPAYGDAEWPGCWYRFSIGDVDFFMLDGRYYRTNPYAPNPTMLGPVQKEWLKKELLKSQGTFKVLCSPVPWAFDSKPGAVDTWNGFREERTELFDFLAENKIEGVFLLSSDRHRCDVWENKRPNGYSLFEFENARLTNQHVAETIPEAIYSYNDKQVFGFLRFDTTLPDPAVIYESYSIDDEVVQTWSLKRSELSHN